MKAIQPNYKSLYQLNPTLAKRGITFADFLKNPSILWNLSEYVNPEGLTPKQLEVRRRIGW